MMAIMCPGVIAVVAAAPVIMSRNPAAPAMAVMSWNPDPVISLVPVTATMVIGPVADTDGEFESTSLLNKRRTDRRHSCQED
jgi:hypothetical protein